MTWHPPTPDEQVWFLRNLQRLLAEGQFTASYKFALVHALADLAVLNGDDSGSPLDVRTRDIAAKVVELYWRQARPFQPGGGADGLVLRQNTDRQAAIVAHVAAAQAACGGSLARLKRDASGQWAGLVGKVDEVVREMPLWKLQTVGGERLEFLYPNVGRGTRITLKPGVAYCLRAFYELVRDLIEGAWVRFVQRVNAPRVGSGADLGTFLFGQERASLEAYRPILVAVQRDTCLYCRKRLSGRTQVDHFVPWSRYPVDLGHNFVLAHERCNNAKSDFLAAEDHLAAWVGRNRECRAELDERLGEAGLPCDPTASVQVARWVYRQTAAANGQVWVAKRVLRQLGPEWADCLTG